MHSPEIINCQKKIHLFFNFGLDISLLYYDHWNRNMLYEASLTTTGILIKPVRERVKTIGLTYSMAFEKVVLRGDAVTHLNYPISLGGLGTYEKTDFYQTIVGVDYT